MPIGISADHRELGQSIGAWAASLEPLSVVRAAEHDNLAEFPEIAAAVADMGIAGIAIAEAAGGGGGSVVDLAVALEATARSLIPGPLLGTAVASLLDHDLLAGIADGSVRVALAARSAGEVGPRFTGSLPVVHDACGATHVLVPATQGWVLIDLAGAAITPLASPDLTRRVAAIELTDAPVHVAAGGGKAALATVVSAEASGVAAWCLETAVAYAKVRQQFGQPIGAFQAIKHLCAEMLETAESVTAVAWDAARAFDEEPAQRDFAAAVAGVIALDGARIVAEQCIQVLGGIGFTFEHDAHFYLRRVLALQTLLGAAHDHADRLAGMAVAGVRRTPRIEMDGRDAEVRPAVRAAVAAVANAGDRRAALVDHGLLTPHWPQPWGRGADPVEQLVIDQELAAAEIELPDLKIAGWAVPTIVAHGTEAQRERFVKASLMGEITWCQLFSEPEAGSDLASLRTRAVRVDGGWELSGQKVWTSLAHESDWAICLARTEPDVPAHRGITYFLVDMTSPGLEIRPLREMTGEAMFNEVFLDRVFVPDDCLVGTPGQGWALARTTLANERVAMASARLGLSVEEVVSLAAEGVGPVERVQVGQCVAWASVASLLSQRAVLRSVAGGGPGPESSVAKLIGVRVRQGSAALVVDLLGDRILLGDERARSGVHQRLLTRCLSIAGGTTQVLRNVAAERILGLPR